VAYTLAIVSMVILAATGCSKEDEVVSIEINDQLKSELERVSEYRIFFGHQSVGDNIVAGLEDIKTLAGGIGPKVVALEPGTPLPETFFAHGYVGGNRSPQTKFDDFEKAVDNQLAGHVDVAFMKLCYVDIHKDTDINALFESYAKTVKALKSKYPNLNLVHVTTPLMIKEGWSKMKYYVKAILGVENDNEKRNAFNVMIRERFQGEPIFDLEAIQSTRPDGRKETFGKDGKVLGLAHAYTYDGGHLNEMGRRLVAKELVVFLAGISIPSSNRSEIAPIAGQESSK
jgi:hypothetical protein